MKNNNHSAYMAPGPNFVPRTIPQEHLDTDCIVVSAGGLNFEYTSYSTRTTTEWSHHLGIRYPGDKKAWYDFGNPQSWDIFKIFSRMLS